jgi:hypothetical protein
VSLVDIYQRDVQTLIAVDSTGAIIELQAEETGSDFYGPIKFDLILGAKGSLNQDQAFRKVRVAMKHDTDTEVVSTLSVMINGHVKTTNEITHFQNMQDGN